MRAREVMVHAVDLGTGVGFADLPAGLPRRPRATDIVGKRTRPGAGVRPALASSRPTADCGGHWPVDGARRPSRHPRRRHAYLTGRAGRPVSTTAGDRPELPAWL